ncbi:MAG: hypothetical protein JNJ72_20755, partial [Anaerolineales bacterium]|nr:hypothetical protein [Anaerolineales bacterium]
HQPVEHLAALRAIPNLAVFRPADAVETLECWQLALQRHDGPSLLALTRQNLATLRQSIEPANACARGGYVLAEAEGGDIGATAIGIGGGGDGDGEKGFGRHFSYRLSVHSFQKIRDGLRRLRRWRLREVRAIGSSRSCNGVRRCGSGRVSWLSVMESLDGFGSLDSGD